MRKASLNHGTGRTRAVRLPSMLLAIAMVGACASTPSGAEQIATPAFETADTIFAEPYIDISEWRDAPVRHYYVHGGFKGTDTRFSFYMPPQEQFDGRFFQHVTPIPLNENLAQQVPAGPSNNIGFSIASGAYFVETNGGGSIDLTKGSQALTDPTITAFRANAASAQFSRVVAQQLYKSDEHIYGYIYGGSGGAFRTIGSLESTDGVWDGGVPYVNGSTMAIPNMFTVRMQALRVLRDKFPQIIDAMDPGGSGDPYAGLNDYEASVLREVDNMGFPMESWFGYKTMGLHGFAALYGGVAAADPTYFTDFWTKPGYLGHDRPDLFANDRLQFASTVAAPITAESAASLGLNKNAVAEQDEGGVDNAFKGTAEEAAKIIAVRLSEAAPDTYVLGAELLVKSGEAAGERIMVEGVEGDIVLFGVVNPATVAKLQPGDAVVVDNSNFLAMESYHRHQVPAEGFPVWDQFRDGEGKPIYPQRPMILGPLFVQSTAGTTMTGELDEKIMLVASLLDREAMPWQADWYRRRVEAQSGTDKVRLYFSDRALHGDEILTEGENRIVTYRPMLQQALRDLSAWVEDGTEPPASTNYQIADGQVIVPGTAQQRQGFQPVVDLTVSGGEAITIGVGEEVTLTGKISVPAATGSIIAAEWDLAGTGDYAQQSEVPAGKSEISVSVTHSYNEPGTYFPALRGVSQRHSDADTPYARVPNLDRVRVIVE